MGFFGIIHKFYYIFSYHLDCDSNQLSCNLQLRHYKQALLWKKNFMFMKNHLNGQVNWTPESNRSTCRYHIGHMQYYMREAYSAISKVPANLMRLGAQWVFSSLFTFNTSLWIYILSSIHYSLLCCPWFILFHQATYTPQLHVKITLKYKALSTADCL